MIYFPLLINPICNYCWQGGQLAPFEGSHRAPFRGSACRHLTTKRKYDVIAHHYDSKSKKLRKSYSDQKLDSYQKVIARRSEKGISKSSKVVVKSKKRIKKEMDWGEFFFNFAEFFDFLLNLIAAVLEALD